MDKSQELEWLEAQKIVVSVDLVAAAKQQLQFLEAVDRNRCLYDGPLLNKAIYRYKNYWLPLLAKHTGSTILEGPLVVPLDCEWIWHCHRLNPVQYKKDCEKLYGQILDNHNVVSSVQGTSMERSAKIWSSLYPEEPYELDLSIPFSEAGGEKFSGATDNINYDLISAVKRQCSFVYQVSRPTMHDDRFLKEAVARYKGFLHLIKRNRERSLMRFCVPTYDIDLMWHSHQLQPVSYCKDLVKAVGKVLEHDDTDSDRSKGKKLDFGFSATTKQWEVTFGLRYWRAGAMYRGSAPSAVTTIPWPPNILSKNTIQSSEHQKLQLSQIKVVEVLLEIVGVRNLPAGHRGNFCVSLRKSQPDMFFQRTRQLRILSESGEKQVATFQCEPSGELLLTLKSHSLSKFPIPRSAKTMGTTSITLLDFSDPISKLSVQKWFELVPNSGNTNSMPICLHIAASFTVPVPVPYVVHMVPSCPFSVNTCLPLRLRKVQQLRGWTHVVDHEDSEIISIKMRNSKEAVSRNKGGKREVVGMIGCSGETCILAESVETGWALLDSSWFLQLNNKSMVDEYMFKLRGNQPVKLFPGRKLEFELRCCNKEKDERDFMTVVRFSANSPYGKALALINLKSGLLLVNEEWFVLPGIVLAFILSYLLRKEGYSSFVTNREFIEDIALAPVEEISRKVVVMADKSSALAPEKGSGCGSDCGNGCDNTIKSSGCGNCGSECGEAVKRGGCGSGCGGGCGSGSGNGVCRGFKKDV